MEAVIRVSLTTCYNYCFDYDCCRFSSIFDPINCVSMYVLNLCDGGSLSLFADKVQKFSVLEDEK